MDLFHVADKIMSIAVLGIGLSCVVILVSFVVLIIGQCLMWFS